MKKWIIALAAPMLLTSTALMAQGPGAAGGSKQMQQNMQRNTIMMSNQYKNQNSYKYQTQTMTRQGEGMQHQYQQQNKGDSTQNQYKQQNKTGASATTETDSITE